MNNIHTSNLILTRQSADHSNGQQAQSLSIMDYELPQHKKFNISGPIYGPALLLMLAACGGGGGGGSTVPKITVMASENGTKVFTIPNAPVENKAAALKIEKFSDSDKIVISGPVKKIEFNDEGAGKDVLLQEAGKVNPKIYAVLEGYGSNADKFDLYLITGDKDAAADLTFADGNGAESHYFLGNAGDDTIIGGSIKDWLYGQDGGDALSGGGGDDILFGGMGVDTLEGGTGADTLDGGAGADELNGGIDAVRDTLTGGDGIDTFYLSSENAAGVASADLIKDFEFGTDLLAYSGDDIWFLLDTSKDPDELVLYADANGSIVLAVIQGTDLVALTDANFADGQKPTTINSITPSFTDSGSDYTKTVDELAGTAETNKNTPELLAAPDGIFPKARDAKFMIEANDYASFVVNEVTGSVTWADGETINFEDKVTYTFKLLYVVGDITLVSQTVTVTVNDVDPEITSDIEGTALTEEDEVDATTVIYTATAIPDTSGDVIFWELSGVNSGLFTISNDDATKGQVTFTAAETPDHEGNPGGYKFTLGAKIGGGAVTIDDPITTKQVVTIPITDIYDAGPTFTSGGEATITEGPLPTNGVIYTALATPDGVDTVASIVYRLIGDGIADDKNILDIDETSGEVTFKSTANITSTDVDAVDAKPSYMFTVEATSTVGGGSPYMSSQTVIVTVGDINDEDPEFTSGAAVTMNAVTGIGYLGGSLGNPIYTAVATPDVSNDNVVYGIKSGFGDDIYNINSSSGIVRFKIDTTIKADGNYGFTVTARVGDLIVEKIITWAVVAQGSTAGDDTINGSFAKDILFGLGGNDVLNGKVGVDILNGGEGDDILNGGVHADMLNGGAHNSNGDTASYADARATTGRTVTVVASRTDGIDSNRVEMGVTGVFVDLNLAAAAQDTDGNSEATGDELTGIENLTGSAFKDVLVGNSGNNILTGGAGADILIGGGGNDTASYANAAVVTAREETVTALGTAALSDDIVTAEVTGVFVNLTLGADAQDNAAGVNSEATGDELTGITNLTGSAFDDVLVGNTSNNILTGGVGADTLIGGGITSALLGDTASYANAEELDTGRQVAIVAARIIGISADRNVTGVTGVFVDLNLLAEAQDNAVGVSSEATGDKLIGITNLIGSASNDVLVGNAGINILTGGGGADTLIGGGGADTLNGGAGADTLNGGAGADTLNGGDGDDDTASYVDSDAGVTVDLSKTTTQTSLGDAINDVLSNIENIIGSEHDDILTGNAMANKLTGGAGADTLDGGAGEDTLDGGAGADTLDGGAGEDTLTGGDGADKFVLNWAAVAGDTDIITDFVSDGTGVTVNGGDRIQITTGDTTLDTLEKLGLAVRANTTTPANADITNADGNITYLTLNGVAFDDINADFGSYFEVI